MTNDKKTPREQAEELYRKSQLMAEQDLDVYLGAKQRILDLLTIALTGWQLVPIEECGELAPGSYTVQHDDEWSGVEFDVAYLGPDGRWFTRGLRVNRRVPTHILNPSFGPLPEVIV